MMYRSGEERSRGYRTDRIRARVMSCLLNRPSLRDFKSALPQSNHGKTGASKSPQIKRGQTAVEARITMLRTGQLNHHIQTRISSELPGPGSFPEI